MFRISCFRYVSPDETVGCEWVLGNDPASLVVVGGRRDSESDDGAILLCPTCLRLRSTTATATTGFPLGEPMPPLQGADPIFLYHGFGMGRVVTGDAGRALINENLHDADRIQFYGLGPKVSI